MSKKIFVPDYRVTYDRLSRQRCVMVWNIPNKKWVILARIVKGNPIGTKREYYQHVISGNISQWFPTLRDCIVNAVYGV